MPRIYLDACCLNRPFDDQSQDRIRMEAEAVEIFLRRIQNKQDCWVGSDAIDYEVQQIPDPDRRRRIKDLLEHLDENFSPDDGVFDRARKLCQIGFEGMDSLHVACAEKAGVKRFLPPMTGCSAAQSVTQRPSRYAWQIPFPG